MASFLSMNMTDTSLTPETLRVKVGYLARDIDARVKKESAYKDWLNRYRCLVRPNPPLSSAQIDGIFGRPWLPDDRILMSLTEGRAIIEAYARYRQGLGYWDSFVAYVSGDSARYEQLQSLIELHTVLTAFNQTLTAAMSPSQIETPSVTVSLTPTPHTTIPHTTPSISSLATTTLLSSEHSSPPQDFPVSAIRASLSRVIKALPWRSALLSPLRAMQTYWQSFMTTSSRSLSIESNTMFSTLTFVPTFGGVPKGTSSPNRTRSTRQSMTRRGSSAGSPPAHTATTTVSVTLSTDAQTGAPSTPISTSPPSSLTMAGSSHAPSFSLSASSTMSAQPPVLPPLYQATAALLSEQLKALIAYGTSTRLTESGPSLEKALGRLLREEQSLSDPSSLDDLWQAHIEDFYRESQAARSSHATAILSTAPYHWFGINAMQPDYSVKRFLLHYGRLKNGMHNLLVALNAIPVNDTQINQASTYFANILWEGTLLSNGHSGRLFRLQHDLITKLTTLRQSHSEHGALQELTTMLAAWDMDVRVEQREKKASGLFAKPTRYYSIQVTTNPEGWRLSHQSAVRTLHEEYIRQQQAICALIKHIESVEAGVAEITSFSTLCEPLEGVLRQAMVFASHQAIAQSSRHDYRQHLLQLNHFLIDLQTRYPDAKRKTQQLVLASSSSPSRPLPTNLSLVTKGVEHGLMAVHPNLSSLIQAYLQENPTHRLALHHLSGDVPVDLLASVLRHLTNQETRGSSSSSEIRALIVSEYQCAKRILECRAYKAQADRDSARVDEAIRKRQAVEKLTEQRVARYQIDDGLMEANDVLSQTAKESHGLEKVSSSVVFDAQSSRGAMSAERALAVALRVDTSALESLMQRCLSVEQTCLVAMERCDAADGRIEDLWTQKQIIDVQFKAIRVTEQEKSADELMKSLPIYRELAQTLLNAIHNLKQAYHEKSQAYLDVVRPHHEAIEIYQEATIAHRRLIDEARANYQRQIDETSIPQLRRQQESDDKVIREESDRVDEVEEGVSEWTQRADEAKILADEAKARADEETRKRQESEDDARRELARAENAERKLAVLVAAREAEEARKAAKKAAKAQDKQRAEDGNTERGEVSMMSLQEQPSPGTSDSGLFSISSSPKHYSDESDLTLDTLPDATSPSDLSLLRTGAPVVVNATDRHMTSNRP